jgi:hypothetical protein
MSSTSHDIVERHEIVRHQLTVPQLYELLKHAKALSHPGGLERALEATKSGVATAEDWSKFFTAVNSVADVPVISVLAIDEDDTKDSNHPIVAASADTVIAAIALAIQIAEILWNFFSGFDDKEVRCIPMFLGDKTLTIFL